MSGFTRLTRKYGILHFLTLVLHCRRAFKASIKEHGGRLIKYDGDNIIVEFDDIETALRAMRSVHSTVEMCGSPATCFAAVARPHVHCTERTTAPPHARPNPSARTRTF